MGNLDAAHLRAGQAIRRQLEEQAEVADLSTLERTGTLDFSLPEGGGALSAYRIEEISPTVVSVPEQHIGHPFAERDY
jgi:hypothetical protein